MLHTDVALKHRNDRLLMIFTIRIIWLNKS